MTTVKKFHTLRQAEALPQRGVAVTGSQLSVVSWQCCELPTVTCDLKN
jgi:hypothetical protein